MAQTAFLRGPKLPRFLKHLSQQFDVYIPVKKKNRRIFEKAGATSDPPMLGEVRTFEPLKAFFSRAREKVAEDFKIDAPLPPSKPTAVFGAKACDLKGFKIQDFVFQDHGTKDPFYVHSRSQNLIIGADCTFAIDTCFCVALGLEPHPTEDFDLNFSDSKDGFFVEAGSARGETILKEHPSLFETPTEENIKERNAQRARVLKAVEENLIKFSVPKEDSFPGIIERNWVSPLWEEEAATCVECGACTNICPTCHCFFLYDQQDESQMNRMRIWDSCLLKDYARVAGGGNPRKKLWMRLRNRFEKKFDYFPKVAEVTACTGCGRCITACPAKIDIRRVLKKLVGHA